MNKYSNFEMPAASGPGGPKNIELTGNEEAGVSKKDAKKLLDEVKSSNDPQKLTEKITSVADNVQNKDLQKKLYHLSDTTQMASDPKKRTKDPQTGELDPGPDQYADKIAREFLAEVKAVYNFRESQKVQQRKKKTRGNPFRVLMGKVGKLLDHGVEKNDIVRTIAKLKFWEKPMIEKAVEIVQDYNRKQRSKKDDNEK